MRRRRTAFIGLAAFMLALPGHGVERKAAKTTQTQDIEEGVKSKILRESKRRAKELCEQPRVKCEFEISKSMGNQIGVWVFPTHLSPDTGTYAATFHRDYIDIYTLNGKYVERLRH